MIRTKRRSQVRRSNCEIQMSADFDTRKFEETLKEYAKWTSRTARQIVDTKAWYVARKATWFTLKADPWKIKQQLGGIVRVNRLNKKGKVVKRRELQLVRAMGVNAPLAALIVNARRGRAGEKGLYGRAMEKALFKLLGARMRSVAFLKSGWVPAIHGLAPFADRSSTPPMDKEARQIGRPKGTMRRIGSDTNPVTEIINLATAKRDMKGALIRYASDGLQQALDDERNSMNEYIERKMRPDAEKFNQAQK